MHWFTLSLFNDLSCDQRHQSPILLERLHDYIWYTKRILAASYVWVHTLAGYEPWYHPSTSYKPSPQSQLRTVAMFKRWMGNGNSTYTEPLLARTTDTSLSSKDTSGIQRESPSRYKWADSILFQEDTEWPEIRSRFGHRRGPLKGYTKDEWTNSASNKTQVQVTISIWGHERQRHSRLITSRSRR